MLRPTGNRVLVRIEPEPEKVGSIHIPFTRDSQWGIVAAIGPKVNDLVLEDRVYFVPQRSFNEIILNGVRHKLFHEQDLEAKEMREAQPIPV